MTMLNLTQCKLAKETVSDVLYLFPSFLNTSSACTSFGVFYLIYRHFRFRIDFHINAKILVFFNMMSILLFSSATLVSYGSLFFNAIVAQEDCDFLFFTQSCTHLRRVFLFSIMLTTLTHTSMVIERGYATLKLSVYEEMGPKLGVVLSAMSISFSIAVVALVTGNEDKSEMLTNCFAFSSSPSIGSNVYNMFAFQLTLEVLTWCLFFLLSEYHNKTLSRQAAGLLPQRYQVLENQILLRQMGPLILVSSAIIGAYIVTSSTGRLFRDAFTVPHYKQFASFIFLMPHNALITMALYYFLFKRVIKERQERFTKTLSPPLTGRKDFMEVITEYWNEQFVATHGPSPHFRQEITV